MYVWVALFFILLLAHLIQFRKRHSQHNAFQSYFSKCKAHRPNEYSLEESCTQKATFFHVLTPGCLKAIFRETEKVIAAKVHTKGREGKKEKKVMMP